MALGHRRTQGARIAAILGFVCGLLGLVGGLSGHALKLGALGWFTGGGLLTLLAVFALIDGALAGQKAPEGGATRRP